MDVADLETFQGTLTVYPLLVCRTLPLLGLIPIDDQAVTERKCSARVRSAVFVTWVSGNVPGAI